MKSRGFQKLILTFALPPFFCQERVRAGAIVRLCKRRQFSALFPFVYPSTVPFTNNGIVPFAVLQNTVTVFLKYPFPSGVIFTFISDRKSTRLNSSHVRISYAVFCLKKKKHYI